LAKGATNVVDMIRQRESVGTRSVILDVFVDLLIQGVRKNIGCEQELFRKDLDIHKVECQYRKIACDFCNEKMIYKSFIDKKHLQLSCPNYLIECPNKCGESFQRNSLQQHDDICTLKVIDCPLFHENLCVENCNGKILRNHFNEHMNKIKVNGTVIAKLIDEKNEMQNQVDELKIEIVSIKKESKKQIDLLNKISVSIFDSSNYNLVGLIFLSSMLVFS
jgi:hypothetical protein